MPTRRSEVTKSGLTERFLKTFEPVTVGEWPPAGSSEQGCPGSDPWPTEERPGKPSRALRRHKRCPPASTAQLSINNSQPICIGTQFSGQFFALQVVDQIGGHASTTACILERFRNLIVYQKA